MATYRIDPDSLREVPGDVTAVWAHVEALEARGAEADGERVAWLRILGALASAETLAWADVARRGGPGRLADLPTTAADLPRAAYRPLLRLAHVLHWQRRHEDAHAVVDAVRDAASATVARAAADGDEAVRRDGAAVLGFADQHQGKVRYDEGRYAEAAALFAAALERRQREEAPADQVASSRQALEAARRRQAGVAPSVV